MKRLFDLALAVVGLVLLAPILATIAMAVRATSSGGAIFKQTRVGRNNCEFTLYKFRTMHMGSTGAMVTGARDPRITSLGRLLRRTKADELPQLWNVVKGDMSFVGPRPEVRKFVDMWPKDARDAILAVRPGITDPATIVFRNEEGVLADCSNVEEFYVDNILPKKVGMYLDYVERANFLYDLGLVLKTLRTIV